jgi:ribonuclease P protein component
MALSDLYEAYIPTKKKAQETSAWLPAKNANHLREAGYCAQKAETAQAAYRLILAMPSKLHRITRAQDFQILGRRGMLIRTPLFHLRFMRTHLPHPRFAVVVSKRIAKNAVARNKLRRRFRAIAQKSFPRAELSVDVIVYTRSGSIHSSFQELEVAFTRALKRAGLLH